MAVYYVAKTGNNSNTGTSPGAAWLDITYGISNLSAGDTLLIRAGVYFEAILGYVPSGTDWGNTVRIAAYPGTAPYEAVTIQGAAEDGYVLFPSLVGQEIQYVEFEGLKIDGSFCINGAVKFESGGPPYGALYDTHHMRLRNCEVLGTLAGFDDPNSPGAGCGVINYKNSGNETGGEFCEYIGLTVHQCNAKPIDGSIHGFYIATSNNLIEDCNVYDCSGACIQLWNEYTANGLMVSGPDNNTVRNNYLHDSSGAPSGRCWGIVDGMGDGNVYYNNVIWNINSSEVGRSHGIHVLATTNVKAYNNTVVDCLDYGIRISWDNGDAQNNIAYNCGTDFADEGIGGNFANNFETADGDPKFNDYANDDFSLRSDSPCIDAGADLSGTLTTDILGATRPFGSDFDKGAYEFGGTVSPAAIQLVNRGAGAGNAASGSSIATAGLSITTGNLIVVYVYGDTPATQTTLFDTAGNTYSLAYRGYLPGENVSEIWYAWNCIGNSSNVVTAIFDNATTYRVIKQLQFSGVDASSDPLVDSDAGSGSGTSFSVPSLTHSGTTLFVAFGWLFSWPATWVPGSGYSLASWAITGDPTDYYFEEYKVDSADSSPSATHTNLDGITWHMFGASFSATAGGGTSGLARLDRGDARGSLRGMGRGRS